MTEREAQTICETVYSLRRCGKRLDVDEQGIVEMHGAWMSGTIDEFQLTRYVERVTAYLCKRQAARR